MPSPKIVFLPHGNLEYSQLPPDRRAWVMDHSYQPLFDLVEQKGWTIGFEASGRTVDLIAEQRPQLMAQIKSLVAAGQVEPVGSPYTHIMLSNVPPDLLVDTLVHGADTWEKHAGKRPTTGWNPECGWSADVPAAFHEAGYETLVMDADSFLLSFEEVRKATGLAFDVQGHSNKNQLFRIEDYIADKPDFLKYLTNPAKDKRGLQLIFRSDMMSNFMLWFLMGATEELREQPVSLDEVKDMLARWQKRAADTGTFIMPYAEDAEYIGTSAYFYVKQFGQARFFEPEPASVDRFASMIAAAQEVGYELATPSQVVTGAQAIAEVDAERIDNGVAWHGGTAKAWANTPYARVLDPTCQMIVQGIRSVADATNVSMTRPTGLLQEAMRSITAAYVSDARWPPAPTSPGRFNVNEALDAMSRANAQIGEAMQQAGLGDKRSLYSPGLMQTQIDANRGELMGMSYFGEQA